MELPESPDECETFGQEFRLAFGAVAEYGNRGLAVRGDAEHRLKALKRAVMSQGVVGQDEDPGAVPYPGTVAGGLQPRLGRSIKQPR